jgi:hypothetical protein
MIAFNIQINDCHTLNIKGRLHDGPDRQRLRDGANPQGQAGQLQKGGGIAHFFQDLSVNYPAPMNNFNQTLIENPPGSGSSTVLSMPVPACRK